MTRAKRQWEIEVVARDELPSFSIPPIGADGLVVEVVELEDAASYVVPRSFDAFCQGDPDLPCDVTLEVDVSITDGANAVVIAPSRSNRRSAKWPLSRVPEREWVGYISLPVPQLLRDALAHAAMPRSKPMIEEMGYHVEAVLETLPVKRRPRILHEDRDLFLHHYAKALHDDRLETETERLCAVWSELHQHDPERWPDLTSVERLKREADSALTRAAGWDSMRLQPGSYTLPTQ